VAIELCGGEAVEHHSLALRKMQEKTMEKPKENG